MKPEHAFAAYSPLPFTDALREKLSLALGDEDRAADLVAQLA
jgi:hypothetical protein